MKIYCNECKRRTFHAVELSSQTTEFLEEWDVDIFGTWELLCCEGCREYTMRVSYSPSEDLDPDTGEPINSVVSFLPERKEGWIETIELDHLPETLRQICRESVEALNKGLLTLCAGGLRAVVEGICQDQGVHSGLVKRGDKEVTSRKLDGRISGLHQRGILTKAQAETLHAVRFLGNDALHELARPSKRELVTAVDIIRHALYSLYSIGRQAEFLATRRTKRKGD